jgi:glycosyltransferase involved in cell wall biosynthesis
MRKIFGLPARAAGARLAIQENAGRPAMLYLDTFGASGGVGRCSVELLPALARRVGTITVAGQSHVVDSYCGTLTDAANLKFWNLERPRFHPGALAIRIFGMMRPRSALFTHALLDRAKIGTKNSQPVLINYPQELAPPEKDYAFDIFLHDLNWRRFPENASHPDDLDRRTREWVGRARRVFTNSDFTRDEILDAYGTDPVRVISAPLAPPSLGHTPAHTGLERFGLKPGGYFFYPSAPGFHKGHDVLADALALDEAPAALPVVITAPIAPDPGRYPAAMRGYLETVAGKLAQLERTGKIISLPGLAWNDVILLAKSCRAYVLPSRFEGFGFPLVEAMALGKFSICSEIPAFREILDRYGPAIHAATFPAGDAPALHDLIAAKTCEDIVPPDAGSPLPDLSRLWNWNDTANAIAAAL